jgi:hypothetical protein
MMCFATVAFDGILFLWMCHQNDRITRRHSSTPRAYRSERVNISLRPGLTDTAGKCDVMSGPKSVGDY